jgi:hypothetical protein
LAANAVEQDEPRAPKAFFSQRKEVGQGRRHGDRNAGDWRE